MDSKKGAKAPFFNIYNHNLNFYIMNKEQVLGVLRHSLTFLGGILVAHGVVDDAMFTELSGAFITLVGGLWSILIKK